MAKVYSWKIDSNNYGYLYIPSSDTHISQKITEKHILDEMVSYIGGWSVDDAHAAFDEMVAEMRVLYPNKDMAWSDDYWTSGGVQGQSVVLISGKENDDKADISETLEGFMADVNARIASAATEISASYQDSIERLNAKISAAIGEVQELVDSAMDELDAAKTDLTNKIDDAKGALTDVTNMFDSGVTPDKIIDVVKKVDDIPDDIVDINDKFDAIDDKFSDYDDQIAVIDSDYHVYHDWIDPVKDEDPLNWKNMFDNYDEIEKKLKRMGLLDTGPDDDTFGVMQYFSNAIINMSGDVADIKSDVDITNDKVEGITAWKDAYSGKVEEAVALVDNMDNTISGKVATMVSATIGDINNRIDSLSGRVQSMEMEQHGSGGGEIGGNSGGGNGNAGSEMTQSSNTIAQNGGNFTQTNESGFTITMADSGITLTNGTDSIILDSNGITLSGRIHMTGTLDKSDLREIDLSH